MEEKTLFKLARAITDTGTDTVSSKGGTVTYRITSLKRKLVNGKVVLISTPSCTLGSASVSWATWGGVTVGNGYLDVKINYSENTGSSRSTTLTFTQNGSNNKINLTVTQGSGVTYTGYIKMVSNTLPLGSNKGNTANILVVSYLNGSDGSKKQEAPNMVSAPDWCSVSAAPAGTLENYYRLTLTALSSNRTGANRSGHIFLTCGDANLSIPVTQTSIPVTQTITITGLPDKPCYLFASGHSPQSGSGSYMMYLMMNVLNDSATMNIPITVNLSSYGDTTKAAIGDTVTVWTSSGSSFSKIGSFIVVEGTVSI